MQRFVEETSQHQFNEILSLLALWSRMQISDYTPGKFPVPLVLTEIHKVLLSVWLGKEKDERKLHHGQNLHSVTQQGK